ncbi:MAG: threonine synthase [Acidobacteria bacterium]|nr:MAG: threonine synthase [Acidobacteriota bacterium]
MNKETLRFTYKCSECGKSYAIAPGVYTCPDCAKKQEANRPLRGVLDVQLFGLAPESRDVRDFLPVPKAFFPAIPVGNTPLWEPERIRKKTGFNNLFIKDDGLNPTGSLKDRASYLVAAFARQHSIKSVIVASTGNAASSMSGVGAAAGLNVTIFIPKTAPEAKMVQSLQYGARVILVDGTYDDAYELSMEFAAKNGGLNRNTAYNPLTIEGKKTVALEIFFQLGRVPELVFVPVGDGVIISGIFKGFRDLLQLTLADRMPTIVAVQAEGSSAICRAMKVGGFNEPQPSDTVADSISVDVPRNGIHTLSNLKKYHGKCITVSDGEILHAQKQLSSNAGLFAEPAAATAFSGFLKLKNELDKAADIVVLSTGNGLKDIVSARKGVTLPASPVKTLGEIR